MNLWLGTGPCRPSLPDPVYDDDESVFDRDESPSKLGDRRAFDEPSKHAARGLGNGFPETSAILSGMYKAIAQKDKISLLVIDSVSAKAKSADSMRNVIPRAQCLLGFYLDIRSDAEIELTGEQSMVLRIRYEVV